MNELRQCLSEICSEYATARTEDFSGHRVGQLLRQTAPDLIRSIITEHADQYTVKGSCGQSQWAEIPWVSVMDTLVTNTTTRGYYIVYLLSSDLSSIYLCMGQGVTAVKKEFKAKHPTILAQRAELIRVRVPDYESNFPDTAIELNGRTPLGKSYGPGVAFAKRYDTNSLPGDDELASDLIAMLQLYIQLVYAGGVDLVEQPNEPEDIEIAVTAEEKKRFREHRRIEGRIDSSKVKRIKGYICEACEFDFEKTYGELGKGFIEAHHLQPFAELKPGKKRMLDLKADFAVLCANCHRMAHRLNDPSNIDALISLLKQRDSSEQE